MALAYSPDGKVIATESSDNTVRLWEPHSLVFRLIYDFDPATVSAVLRFVREMQRDELQIEHVHYPQTLFPAIYPDKLVREKGRDAA